MAQSQKKNKKRLTQSPLVFVLHVIDWEDGTSYMDQSLSEIGKNNAIHVYILHSIAHGCHRLGKSQGKIKFLKVRKIQEISLRVRENWHNSKKSGKIQISSKFQVFHHVLSLFIKKDGEIFYFCDVHVTILNLMSDISCTMLVKLISNICSS